MEWVSQCISQMMMRDMGAERREIRSQWVHSAVQWGTRYCMPFTCSMHLQYNVWKCCHGIKTFKRYVYPCTFCSIFAGGGVFLGERPTTSCVWFTAALMLFNISTLLISIPIKATIRPASANVAQGQLFAWKQASNSSKIKWNNRLAAPKYAFQGRKCNKSKKTLHACLAVQKI